MSEGEFKKKICDILDNSAEIMPYENTSSDDKEEIVKVLDEAKKDWGKTLREIFENWDNNFGRNHPFDRPSGELYVDAHELWFKKWFGDKK